MQDAHHEQQVLYSFEILIYDPRNPKPYTLNF